MSRLKKSRTLKGKLGKTGTKEMLKEQKKARKAATPSKFLAKKAKQRKDQAARKLERLGLAPEPVAAQQKVRPKRFIFTPKTEGSEVTQQQYDSEMSSEVSANDLLNALTEQN